MGEKGVETEQGQFSCEDGYVYLCVFPVLIHSFEYGLPSQSLGPPSLSPAPLSQHHLPGMSFPKWGFLTWTLASNRPDLSGDSAPSQASLSWVQGENLAPRPVPSGKLDLKKHWTDSPWRMEKIGNGTEAGDWTG